KRHRGISLIAPFRSSSSPLFTRVPDVAMRPGLRFSSCASSIQTSGFPISVNGCHSSAPRISRTSPLRFARPACRSEWEGGEIRISAASVDGRSGADMQYRFEGFVLDADRRELVSGGEAIGMGPQVFDLLTYLVDNRARVVTKDDLIDV